MDKQIHPNYITASNLIFVSVSIGLINFFIAIYYWGISNSIVVAIGVLFNVGLGYFARQGYNWIKYLLLIITLLGMIGVLSSVNNMMQNPIVGRINVAVTMIQVWATVLLFKVPKRIDTNLEDNDILDKPM